MENAILSAQSADVDAVSGATVTSDAIKKAAADCISRASGTEVTLKEEDGTAIDGLYATGDCSGGMFATTYPNLMIGLACGRTMTFARHAAKQVAKR